MAAKQQGKRPPGTRWLEEWLRDHGVENAAQQAAEIMREQGGGGTGSDDERESAGGFTEPPPGTYDPAIMQQLEAIERGLADTLEDTAEERDRLRQDLATELKDIAVSLKRGKQDIRRSRQRGLEDIDTQRKGVRIRRERGEQDFARNMDELVHRYSKQGLAQGQALNAAGLSEGAAAASAAKRAENFDRDRQPLDVARVRLGEDVERALTGLGEDETRLRQDTGRDLTRLKSDAAHDERLATRQEARAEEDIHTERQRAKREAALARPDLIEQAVFDARQRHPGAFDRYGDKRKKKKDR